MPKIPGTGGMIALDTEATGLDLYHGARPFFVTICKEGGEQLWWEWPVDPLIRQPEIPEADLTAIRVELDQAERIVGQNVKFDAQALATIGIEPWPWHKTEDTLIASHPLGSNLRHDLTALAMQYLGEDIEPYEERLQQACNEARRLCRQRAFQERHGVWRIARQGLPEMPSAKAESKEKTGDGLPRTSPWAFDMWLPKAVAQAEGYPADHPWQTVLAEYSNADSSVTLAIWQAMEADLKAKDLLGYYRWRLKLPPILRGMEARGATVLQPALARLKLEYEEEIAERSLACVRLARGLGHSLNLPKAGNNKSLTTFAFDVLKLPVLKQTKTGAASFDKEVLEEYCKTLPGGLQLRFVQDLAGARKRQKANEYLTAYEVFGIPAPGNVLVLHSSINATGTATTRFSCSNPNLQQISRQETACEACHGEGCEACGGSGEDLHSVRNVFGPALGREWWSMDAENIELRIPAYESGEPDLIRLFEERGQPPFWGSQHMLNFSIIHPDIWQAEAAAVGWDKVGPHCKKKYASTHYHWTKGGGLAMQYQCGRETANRAFRCEGYDLLKGHFTRLEAHNQRCVRFAERHGYVETIPDRQVNPRHGYPLLCARGEWGKIKPTTPLNYRTQGSAGWWMLKAMVCCEAQLAKWRKAAFDAWTVLTVHDELVFDFPAPRIQVTDPLKSPNLWRARALRRLMEQGGEDLGVPTPVSMEWHPETWGRGVKVAN